MNMLLNVWSCWVPRADDVLGMFLPQRSETEDRNRKIVLNYIQCRG